MRYGLVVDSACDLPAAFYRDTGAIVLPISVHVDGDVFVDDRNPTVTARFLAENLGERGHAAETEPYSADEIRALFLERLVVDYDCVFCLTITSTRSPIHANASQASFSILKDYRPIRRAAGVEGPFLLRVIDTGNLFAAQGVTAVEAMRMIRAGETPGRIRERLESLAQQTYGYMLPRDLYYLRARAQKKGDHSVGWLSAALGSALDIKPLLRGFRGTTGPVAKLRGFDTGARALFDYATARVRAGLLTPTMCLSYGGDLATMHALPGYAPLRQVCEEHDVEVFESVMSITGMINVGTGALTLGFAAPEHEATFG